MAGISESYLSRIERGERFPSPEILLKIAEPLGFDQNELLILAGYISAEPLPREQRDKLRGELRMLLERVASDNMRIKEITERLLLIGD